MGACHIRSAHLSDMDALCDLLGELFAIEADFQADPERQRRGLQLFMDGCGKHRCLHVAELNASVVGMCSAQILVSTAEGGLVALVEDVIVTAPFRGQGIGSRLLASIEAWARQRGIHRLQLLADKTNPSGLDFYKRQAWHMTRLICLRKYCNDTHD